MSEQTRDRKMIFAGKSTKGSTAGKFLLVLQKRIWFKKTHLERWFCGLLSSFHTVENTNSPAVLDIQGH
jgi:hypothetical protein